MPKIKYLYYFSSPEIDVVETKRLDLEDAPLSEIYKWIIIWKDTGKVWELDFKSMNKNEIEESREFIEGSLGFNDKEATLKIFNHKFLLKVMRPEEIPSLTDQIVTLHLASNFPNAEKYYFRSLRPADLWFFVNWIFDKEVIRYSMTKFHRITSTEQVMEWFSLTLNDSHSFQVGIVDTNTHELIGYAGIAGLNEIDHNGEYFIFIGNKDYWGKGIASSVTSKIIEHGFLNLKLHRIFLTASSKNLGAIKAYERAGFRHEGKMREAFYRYSEFSDKVIMGTLRSEFENK
ncbi:MAG TPA: GNAT family protein [Bacteriovoracaceae bacterium]|nr:GNAT family protein [Bacteriovoracaceae bacterium]